MVNNSGGTIINTNRAYYESYYADAVVKFLRATEQPMKIISSVGLTPLSPIFDSEYIRNLNKNRSPYIDTDVDGLPDYKEVDLDSGLINFADDADFLPTIQDCIDHLNKTDKYTYVVDGYDDFWDSQNKIEKRKVFGPISAEVIMGVRILPINSDPTSVDGDEDGLLDGEEIVINNIKVAPRDNEPLKKTPQSELWKHHISVMSNGDIPQSTQSFLNPYIPATIGSLFGNMESDIKFVVHANVEAWQKDFGYSNVYDTGLYIGDSGKMRRLKLPFNYEGKEYIIWAWRGDYLNLGAGAELGIYINTGIPVEVIPFIYLFTPLTYRIWGFEFPTYQYSVVDFYLPMTLHLYQDTASSEYNTVFNWAPTEEQWWITGFVPLMQNHDPSDLIMINSIDFSENIGMYQALKYSMELEKEFLQYLIFDDDNHTVWIIWKDGSL
jgi:hypothetical protein